MGITYSTHAWAFSSVLDQCMGTHVSMDAHLLIKTTHGYTQTHTRIDTQNHARIYMWNQRTNDPLVKTLQGPTWTSQDDQRTCRRFTTSNWMGTSVAMPSGCTQGSFSTSCGVMRLWAQIMSAHLVCGACEHKSWLYIQFVHFAQTNVPCTHCCRRPSQACAHCLSEHCCCCVGKL